ncbi:MAG: response regulator [Pseudomonadota bacterium]
MSKFVLVVDDDAITRFMMREMCEELGFECKVAESGDRCLEMLTSTPNYPYIILMDIHMPELSGDDVCAQVRKLETDPPKNLPIIAVTADEHWRNEARYKAAGFNGFIPKPLTFSRLQSALDDSVS